MKLTEHDYVPFVIKRATTAALLFGALLLCFSQASMARSRRVKGRHAAKTAGQSNQGLSTAAQDTLAKFGILALKGTSSVDLLCVIGGNKETVKSGAWKKMAAATLTLFKASAPGTAFSIVRYGDRSHYMFGEPVDPKTKAVRAKALSKALLKATSTLASNTCDLGDAIKGAIDNLAHKDPNAQHLVIFVTDCEHNPAKNSKYAKGKAPWGLDMNAKLNLKFFTYKVAVLNLSKNNDLSFFNKVFGKNNVEIEQVKPSLLLSRLADLLEKAPATFLKLKSKHEWNRGTLKLRSATEDKKVHWRIPKGKAEKLKLILVNDLPHFDINVKVISIKVDPPSLKVVTGPVGKVIHVPDTQTNNGKSDAFELVLKNNINKGKILQSDEAVDANLVFNVEVSPVLDKGFKELKVTIEPRKESPKLPWTLEFVAGSVPIWLPVLIVIAILLGILMAGILTRKVFPRGVGIEIYGPDGKLIVDAELHEYDLGLFKQSGFVLGDQGDLVAGKDNYLEVLAAGPRSPWVARPLQENMTLNGKPYTGWEKLKVGDEVVSKQDRVVIKFVPVGEQ
ncbi:MAG: VWA domain-containing protein [Deltaproteobacteria bacterium]|nr:VWA domain-containing protein [Deltaproteobacteria bacterium]